MLRAFFISAGRFHHATRPAVIACGRIFCWPCREIRRMKAVVPFLVKCSFQVELRHGFILRPSNDVIYHNAVSWEFEPVEF
jgi:hypothetical protein